MRRNIFLFAIIIMVHIISIRNGYSQLWIENSDIYTAAEEYLNAEEYSEALPLYLLLEQKGINTANISYKIGDCYLNIRGKKFKSLTYLQVAAKNVSSVYENTFSEPRAPLRAMMLLGIAYRIDNRPMEAIKVFDALKDSIGLSNDEFSDIIEMHIKRCKNAILLGAFPTGSRTIKLPENINSKNSNYNPILIRQDSTLLYMEELKFYDALMRVEKKGSDWGAPKNLTPDIKSDGDHVLVGASQDSEQLLLYMYSGLKAGEIFITKRTNNGWSKIEPLNDNINSNFNETYASFSADGKSLYFTSNRPGGYGGLDIYVSKLDSEGKWGKAKNLGPKVNSPYNEACPIMNIDDEILYFSSQGHLNMGGYDVFYSLRKGDNEWWNSVNMGSPVSTTDDDLFYYPLGEEVSGLMARLEKPFTAGYDIYQYNSMVLPNTPRFSIKGSVDTSGTAQKAVYDVYVIDQEKNDTILKTTTDNAGNYDLTLPAGNFEVLLSNKMRKVQRAQINLSGEAQGTMVLNAPIPILDVPAAIKTMGADTLVLKTILYSFNNATVPETDKDYLRGINTIMLRHPQLILKIEGHADALGPEGYNLILSKKRAESIVNFLVTLGSPMDHMIPFGCGEDNPIAPNTNPDGTDNWQGRKFNRSVFLVPLKGMENIVVIENKLMGAK